MLRKVIYFDILSNFAFIHCEGCNYIDIFNSIIGCTPCFSVNSTIIMNINVTISRVLEIFHKITYSISFPQNNRWSWIKRNHVKYTIKTNQIFFGRNIFPKYHRSRFEIVYLKAMVILIPEVFREKKIAKKKCCYFKSKWFGFRFSIFIRN